MLYQRQKFLLALIEVFGGVLSTSDAMRLMLSFNQNTPAPFYDFFPEHTGAYSLMMVEDQQRLIAMGYLAHENDCYRLMPCTPWLGQLKPSLQQELTAFKARLGETWQADIFATQADDWFVPTHVPAEMEACLFTLGYEGLSIDAYLNRLMEHGIKLLVDVRHTPFSHKHGFSKQRLAHYVERVGIEYVHLAALGIPSALRKTHETTVLLQIYQETILPLQGVALAQLQDLLRNTERVALTCFEADSRTCHRRRITDYLATLPDFITPIVHL